MRLMIKLAGLLWISLVIYTWYYNTHTATPSFVAYSGIVFAFLNTTALYFHRATTSTTEYVLQYGVVVAGIQAWVMSTFLVYLIHLFEFSIALNGALLFFPLTLVSIVLFLVLSFVVSWFCLWRSFELELGFWLGTFHCAFLAATLSSVSVVLCDLAVEISGGEGLFFSPNNHSPSSSSPLHFIVGLSVDVCHVAGINTNNSTPIFAYFAVIIVLFLWEHGGLLRRQARMQALRFRRANQFKELVDALLEGKRAESQKKEKEKEEERKEIEGGVGEKKEEGGKLRGEKRKKKKSRFEEEEMILESDFDGVERPDPALIEGMVSWYSVAMAFTVIDMVYSGLFGLRLDKRRLQDSLWDGIDDHLYQKHSSESPNSPFYFDFFADTGDGFDSTYTIARALAQPQIGDLPRAKLVVFGGDLVYPSPTTHDYMKRVVFPFNSAFHPPKTYSFSELGKIRSPPLDSDAPEMLLLPGNHDWIDGLGIFQEHILDDPSDHFAGWVLTQRSSYYATRLPGNWVIFALDSALEFDIDMIQFRRFCEAASTLKKEDRVIIITHQPLFWTAAACDQDDWPVSPLYTRVMSLVRMLGPKCRLLLAGDVHNYVRYEPRKKKSLPSLVIGGGGGAFLHPTHFGAQKMVWKNEEYQLAATYPSQANSRQLSYRNLGKFRSNNLKFDIIGVSIYFLFVLSIFPTCVHPSLHTAMTNYLSSCTSVSTCLPSLAWAVFEAEKAIFQSGNVSVVAYVSFCVCCIFFVQPFVSIPKRIFFGFLHATLHQVAAVLVFCTLAMIAQVTPRLPDQSVNLHEFPVLEAFLQRADFITSGYASSFFLALLQLLDLDAFLTSIYQEVCSHPEVVSRVAGVKMYFVFILLFGAISAPIVSSLLGMYLFIADRVCRIHWEEAFSALSYPHYKSFIRFRVNPQSKDLDCFVLGIERVPQKWKLDPNYVEEMKKNPEKPIHFFRFPSKWVSDQDGVDGIPKVIDTFVIR